MLLSQMTDQIGRVLGDRYRLVAPIGTGSSAQVFLADDVRLRRRVAVKVLHPALADDKTFLRRFRAEAQASAKLNHPNIVTLFDSGNDGGPYLVTEFVSGGSLRAMLDLGHRLSIAQALSVGLDAARGLDFAHRQGFVHRDIKPANLLFGDDGRLRIADFGVARALAEAAWTEPSGAVLGTARYASPEQAQGQPVTGKGDIYSLALVLVEAVTGQVPFAADTTIGTLMARVDKPLDPGPELGALGEVLRRAGRPDPDQRPDAAQLAARFVRLAEELDAPESLPLAGAFPLAELAPFVDPDPTHLPAAGAGGPIVIDRTGERASPAIVAPRGPSVAARVRTAVQSRRRDRTVEPPAAVETGSAVETAPAVKVEVEPAVEVGPVAETGSAVEVAPAVEVETGSAVEVAPAVEVETAPAVDVAPVVEAGPVAEITGAPSEPYGRRRLPRLVLVVAGVVALAIVVAAGMTVRELLRPRHEVPQAQGLDIGELPALVEGNGWSIDRISTRRDGTRPREIIAQDPAPGAQLREGHTFHITVSRGQTLVAVPDNLAGLTQDEVGAALEAVGLRSGEISEKWGEFVPAGVVLGDSLIYDQVPSGTRVPLVFSKGPKPRAVPDGLAGLSYDEAAARLQADGLSLHAVRGEDFSDIVPEGQVIGTNPSSGTLVPRDSEVVVVVSAGPEPIIIPDVSGDTVAEAQAALEAAGLVVGSVDGPLRGTVTGTDPAAGLQLTRGDSVTLITQGRVATAN